MDTTLDCVVDEIDDRKRAEALLAGEKRVLEMVARGSPLPVVLDALCRVVDESAAGCFCSILYVDPDITTFQLGAAPSLPSGYNEAMDGRPVHCDGGPCAMAASLKRLVIAPDIVADTQWDAHGWRALALEHGLRACWSSPILSRSKSVLGTFAIYRGEPGSPTPLHLELIGQLTHIASIAIERATSDAALRRSEAFLAEAQSLSRIGSFAWCVPTDEITWSEQVYRIFELDPSEPMTLARIASRVHPDDMHLMHDMLDAAHSGDTDFEFEHRLQMPDRSVKYLHLIARGTRDQDGRLEYIGAVQDVTERRRSEEALSKARSDLAHVARTTSLGALTASIAHEVNQPLSGIITNASTCLRMLAADPPNIEGARETARRILRDGNRASEVIMRLRAMFSRKDPTNELVDLNDAAREVIALSAGELQRSGVKLRPYFAENLPPVMGDRVQLQQVILNLLLNASEAMSGVDDRPRQLVVRTEVDERDHVRLSVQDTGTGIAAESADTLFDAFYTTKTGGMGIGLSVSRSIIESLEGRIWAVPNDGAGATFSFWLPRPTEAAWPSR
jgi:signal transduction histidine kinase